VEGGGSRTLAVIQFGKGRPYQTEWFERLEWNEPMGTLVGATHDGQLLDIECDEPCFNKQLIFEGLELRLASD
jgi:hypothetical protein